MVKQAETEEIVRATIQEAIKGLKVHICNIPKRKAPVKTHTRTIVAQLSDTHYGANIKKSEMHGINQYNWTIAARRTAYYIQQIIQYKPEYRKNTDVVLQLNGDIIAGLIHDQEIVDLLAIQFVESMNILSQAISLLAANFNNVTIICTSGNHGRNIGKLNKGRATTTKWDSYEYMLYKALEKIFTGVEHVKFIIPKSPFAICKIYGYNILTTHGDTFLNVGNPGSSINIKSITTQINNINSGKLLKNNEKVDVVCVGHTHTSFIQVLQNGTKLINNGCLVGTDPYAQSLGIITSTPAQILFECTPEFAVGDIRIIYVSSADEDSSLDKLIHVNKEVR